MSMYLSAGVLAVQLAAAPANVPAAAPPPATIPEDWAVPPPPSRKEINEAVRDLVAEEKTKEADVPRRHEADTIRGDRYDNFAASFDEAAVPGCLRPDGLKRQPPRIGFIGLGGLLGLPFILLAKVRGKCN
jgi:hypothetical protein